MNYPVWETLHWGAGTWVALIAVLHVYISHLAVGGGIFIWLTDRKAWRKDDAVLHAYLRRHTWFFLYLTMVFGGVTGVGIWFIIALVHPSGTSVLIHNFVFGWAIEWVFFFAEITVLLLYAYQFDRLDRSSRLKLAFCYALFAWLSLFIINGILTFMLTPGNWIKTQSFWQGFFNPTFWPALFFRTAMACMIAGLFGFITSQRNPVDQERRSLMTYCSRWLLYPLPAATLFGVWYYMSLTRTVQINAFVLNAQSRPFIVLLVAAILNLFVVAVLMSLRTSRAVQRVATVLVLVMGLGFIGSFEYLREIARKPFIIGGYLYANSIPVALEQKLDREGVLANARWTDGTAEHLGSSTAGRDLFNLQCLTCHTVGGVRNDILKRTAYLTYTGLLAQLTGQGRALGYMPPFIGTAAEKETLAAYLAGLERKERIREPQPFTIKPHPDDVPHIPQPSPEWVLLVWNDLGMHCMSDSDQSFVFLPPANTLEAQLIKRGPKPMVMDDTQFTLTYRVEKGYENPSTHVRFWDYVQSNFGKSLPKNVGLAGLSTAGAFTYESEHKSFTAKMIPVAPYPDRGGFNPYPLVLIEAREKPSGQIVAVTQAVAPVSTELGCRNCHGGGWRVEGTAGVSQETAENILRVHDRLNRTSLLKDARAGKPHLCQSCHADAAVGSEGKPGILPLAVAMHGWHANYMHAKGSTACALCHPSDPQGRTRCNRGIHAVSKLTCVNCHGELSDHALSLLKGQAGHAAVARLMRTLTPVSVASQAAVNGRKPWVNEPDCLGCHQDFEPPKPSATGFNKWTKGFDKLYRNRPDNSGLHCTVCHGSPHAEYPALNPYAPDRDNIPPLQYTGLPYPIGAEMRCETCHVQKMQYPVHHKNMYRPFRGKVRWEAIIGTPPGKG